MNFKSILLIITTIIVKMLGYNDKILPEMNLSSTIMQQCIFEISKRYAKVEDVNLVLNLNRNYLQFVNFPVPLLMYTELHQHIFKHEFRRINFYVLIFATNNKTNYYENVINFLSKDRSWNSRANFAIITDGPVEEIFKVFMKYFIYNVVILKSQNDKVIDIFSYFPYTTFNIKPLTVCSSGIIDHNDIFPNKLPKMWFNTTLRVAPMCYPPFVVCAARGFYKGIEIRTLELLRSIMGFEIAYSKKQYNHWGISLPNGTYNEAYGDLQKQLVDVGVGVFHTNALEHQDFDMSFSYIEDSTKWIAPAAKPLNYWQNIIRIFTITMWIVVIIFLLLVSIAFYILPKFILPKHQTPDFICCVLSSFQTLLNISTEFFPDLRLVRYIFLLWCMASCMFGAAFNSKLITAFSLPFYEKQVRTLDDAVQLGLKFGFNPEQETFLSSSSNPTEQYISKHYTPCKIGLTCINRTAFKSDFVTIKTKRVVEFLIPIYYIGPNERPLVYIFETHYQHVPFHMYFTKGHPMFEKIDKLLLLMKSSGFIEHFYRQAEDNNLHLLHSKKVDFQSQVLNYEQTLSVFKLLLMGLAISTAVFMVEVLVNIKSSRWLLYVSFRFRK